MPMKDSTAAEAAWSDGFHNGAMVSLRAVGYGGRGRALPRAAAGNIQSRFELAFDVASYRHDDSYGQPNQQKRIQQRLHELAAAVESHRERNTKTRLEERHVIFQQVQELDDAIAELTYRARELLPHADAHYVANMHVVVFELLRLLQHAPAGIRALATLVIIAWHKVTKCRWRWWRCRRQPQS
jgi:hypothetical protein